MQLNVGSHIAEELTQQLARIRDAGQPRHLAGQVVGQRQPAGVEPVLQPDTRVEAACLPARPVLLQTGGQLYFRCHVSRKNVWKRQHTLADLH